MDYLKDISEVRKKISKYKKNNKSIGLVPTMGALHKGHVSLIESSKKSCDITVVSVFVNPIQFGPNEDFHKYPRPIEQDIKICEEVGVDILFNPTVEEIIGDNLKTFVDISDLGDNLCGAKRPSHFRGVATIVSKLFNITTPNRAFFGKKDIQQLYIIKKMVEDLNFNIEIIPCSIIREADGLAMSSRNRYLSEKERIDSLVINRTLKEAVKLIEDGELSSKNIISFFENKIKEINSAKIDYVNVVDENMKNVELIEKGNIIAIAVYIGKTRLIDNHIIGEKICW
ncbi:MAG TPA: pantoate--beta-alanine ligase [Spirochaetota bacterium]|mgnify:FL=1|nr:pantoate--beta-alanine ligase [Spirochaetota bacterium]HOS31912.1 pantoate--beta-alanine ligase [Spirochaetota bacterium]HOS54499.1 pantoate--beta-alanine ligase [Spirochaetota bacterium]HPK62992.1 pantoate--beta-alanine ligase [Spirochaetota bacterium]HQF76992.1 pantoate--beta-alanine ligase [Spirochaetota bacterium]